MPILGQRRQAGAQACQYGCDVLTPDADRQRDADDQQGSIDRDGDGRSKQTDHQRAQRPTDLATAPAFPSQISQFGVACRQMEQRQHRQEDDFNGQDTAGGKTNHDAQLGQEDDDAEREQPGAYDDPANPKEAGQRTRPGCGERSVG
ncbi:MAG: hypothetical protein IPK19_30460 [Chloroflexi bacterium]|nr:hypothetical protein [Chloroflexota bacterium]